MHAIMGVLAAFIGFISISLGLLAIAGVLTTHPAAASTTLLIFTLICYRSWEKTSAEVDADMARRQAAQRVQPKSEPQFTSSSLDDPIDDEELF